MAVMVDSARAARVVGRTEGDAPEIDGRVFVDWPVDRSRPSPGDLVVVEVTGARPYDLLARPGE
jgi:ribosomal protein S12 methylthiotransferase